MEIVSHIKQMMCKKNIFNYLYLMFALGHSQDQQSKKEPVHLQTLPILLKLLESSSQRPDDRQKSLPKRLLRHLQNQSFKNTT